MRSAGSRPSRCARATGSRPRTLLFTLDDDLQRAEVAEREAAVENAKQAYDRAVTLLKKAAGTQKSYEEAEAALRSAQARLNSSQTKLARRKAFSPAAGTVQQIYFRVGELVPAGRPVVALLPPGNMKVRFFVSEATLPQIALDDRHQHPVRRLPERPDGARKLHRRAPPSSRRR